MEKTHILLHGHCKPFYYFKNRMRVDSTGCTTFPYYFFLGLHNLECCVGFKAVIVGVSRIG